MFKVWDLNLNDDLDWYTFEAHCESMYDILCLESPKHAAELIKSDRFWTKKWQVENRQRQREKFLLEMCPKDKRDTYDTGKECTLVHILLRTLPAEYDPAVKSVRDLTKLLKYGLLGDLTQITNKEDNTRTNYDDEWLPPYDELRVELVNSYQLQERRREELGKAIRKHPGHPTLPILPGHDQPGPHQTPKEVLCVWGFGAPKRGSEMHYWAQRYMERGSCILESTKGDRRSTQREQQGERQRQRRQQRKG